MSYNLNDVGQLRKSKQLCPHHFVKLCFCAVSSMFVTKMDFDQDTWSHYSHPVKQQV
jgi:hypothetical protein